SRAARVDQAGEVRLGERNSSLITSRTEAGTAVQVANQVIAFRDEWAVNLGHSRGADVAHNDRVAHPRAYSCARISPDPAAIVAFTVVAGNRAVVNQERRMVADCAAAVGPVIVEG